MILIHFLQSHKKQMLLFGVILILLLILTTLTKPPSTSSLSPFLKTAVGKTTQQDVERLQDIKKKDQLPDGTTQYSLQSPNALIDNVITTKQGIVVFEKSITVTKTFDHPKLSSYRSSYGQPEKEIAGSATYGALEKTYIYASKGFALVANPFTEEIDEIQTFLPTTIDEYIKTWGKDIKQDQTNKEDFGQ